jgi:hypothetical protein
MRKGGKREKAGRKKIGIVVNTRIEKEIVERIEKEFEGSSRAEKIRNCLKKGLGT